MFLPLGPTPSPGSHMHHSPLFYHHTVHWREDTGHVRVCKDLHMYMYEAYYYIYLPQKTTIYCMALVSCFWHFHWTNFAVMLKWLSHMWLRVVGGAWLPRSSGIYSICWIWQLCNLLSKAWNIVEKVCHAHLMLKAWLQGTFVIMTFGGRSLRNFIEISLWTPPNSQNSEK